MVMRFHGKVRAYVRRRWQRFDVDALTEPVKATNQDAQRLRFRLQVGGVDYPPFEIGIRGMKGDGSNTLQPCFDYTGFDPVNSQFEGFGSKDYPDYREDFHLQGAFVARVVTLCERWYLEHFLCESMTRKAA